MIGTTTTNRLPSWLEDLASMINNKNKKEAEVNVMNLPTVNYKDETFYVNLTDRGADLYNKFATCILQIDGAKSIEDVNDYFNANSVVASVLQEDETPDSSDAAPIEDVPTMEPPIEEPNVGDVVTGANEEVFELDEDEVYQAEEPQEETPTEENQEVQNEDSVDTVPEEAPAEEPVEENVEVDIETPVAEDQEISVVESPVSETPNVGVPTTAPGGETFDGAGSVIEQPEVVQDTEEVKNEVAQEGQQLVDELSSIILDSPDTAEMIDGYHQPNKTHDEMHLADEELAQKVEVLEEIVHELSDTIASLNKESKLAKAKYRKLNKKYAELYRAYQVIDNNLYDLNCEEEEMKHVNENAEMTQKVIDKEHELDLSKMSDRGKLNADFLKEVLDEVHTTLDNVSDGIEEAVEVAEENTIEQPEEVPQDVPQEEEQPVEVVMIDSPEMLEEFDDQTCPFCHEQKLELGASKENVQGITCTACKKEFAVTKNKQVFYKK